MLRPVYSLGYHNLNVDDVSHTHLRFADVFFGVFYLQLQIQSALLRRGQAMRLTLLQTLQTAQETHKHQAGAFTCETRHGRERVSYSLAVDDVLVFSGHSGGPFPGFLIQAVLLRRPRLRLQLTALRQTSAHMHTYQTGMGKHTHIHRCTHKYTVVCDEQEQYILAKENVREGLFPSHIINTACGGKSSSYPLESETTAIKTTCEGVRVCTCVCFSERPGGAPGQTFFNLICY